MDGVFGQKMEEALLGADFWEALRLYLGGETLPTKWILNHARLRSRGDPLLRVHAALHEQLLASNLGA